MAGPNDLKIDRVKVRFAQELDLMADRVAAGRISGKISIIVEIPVSQGGLGKPKSTGALEQVE